MIKQDLDDGQGILIGLSKDNDIISVGQMGGMEVCFGGTKEHAPMGGTSRD